MYIVTEYQYLQLRNFCKDAVVDEIGRQPLASSKLTNSDEHEKCADDILVLDLADAVINKRDILITILKRHFV